MSDLGHDGKRSGHSPNTTANTVENLAHDKVPNVIARLSEVNEQRGAKHTPGNAEYSRPVVSSVPTEEARYYVSKLIKTNCWSSGTYSPMNGAKMVDVTEKALRVYPAVAILRP